MTTIEITARISDLEDQIVTLNSEAADHSGVITECITNASRLGKLDAEAYTTAHLGLERCRMGVQGCNKALDGLKELRTRAARVDQIRRDKSALMGKLPSLLDFKADIDLFNAKRLNGDRLRDAAFMQALERVKQFVSFSNSLSGRASELGLQDEHAKVLAQLGFDGQTSVNILSNAAAMATR